MNQNFKKTYVPIFMQNLLQANIGSSAAEMAYYLLLSIFPILLLIANIVPILPFDNQTVVDFVAGILPSEVETLIIPTLENYLGSTNTGIISISLIVSIWTASTAFSRLQIILNRVYGVEPAGNIIINRIFAFVVTTALVLGLGALSIMFVFGETIFNFMNNIMSLPLVMFDLFTTLRWPLLLVGLLIVMIFIFQFVPNHKYPIKYTLIGALVSAVGILLLSSLFGLYVSYFGGSSVTNGTLGVFIVLMLYLYLSSIMVIVGGLVNSLAYRFNHSYKFDDSGVKHHEYSSPNFPNLENTNVAYGVLNRHDKAVHIQKNSFKE